MSNKITDFPFFSSLSAFYRLLRKQSAKISVILTDLFKNTCVMIFLSRKIFWKFFCLDQKIRSISTFDKFEFDCDLKFIAIKKRCGSSEQTAPIINEDFLVSETQKLALGRSSFFCQLVDAR